jgi:plasmid stabilization system protein ParE
VRQLVIRPRAAVDLREAHEWYEDQRLGLGEEFLAEVHGSIERARDLPLSFPVIHRDTRRALVHRFPYGLFFRLVDEIVVVVACYHLRRKPTSWQRRT